MKIILNSDILYDKQLVVDNVTKKPQKLFRACAEMGHVIVIPLTALLEFNRKQSELVEKRLQIWKAHMDCLTSSKFRIPGLNPER